MTRKNPLVVLLLLHSAASILSPTTWSQTLPVRVDVVLDGYPTDASVEFNGAPVFQGTNAHNFTHQSFQVDVPFGQESTLNFLDSYADGFYAPIGDDLSTSESWSAPTAGVPAFNRVPSWRLNILYDIGTTLLKVNDYNGDADDVPAWGEITKSGSLGTGNVNDDMSGLLCVSDDATVCDDIFNYDLSGLFVEDARIGYDLTFNDFDYSVTASGDASGGDNYWGAIGFEASANCPDYSSFLYLNDGSHNNQQNTLNSVFSGVNLGIDKYATGKVYRYIPPDGWWCSNSGSASLSVSNMTLKYRQSKGQRDFEHIVQDPVWNDLTIGQNAIIEFVDLRINSTYIGDSKVTLTHGGTSKVLFDGLGGSGDDLDVKFTDFATNRITNSCDVGGACFNGEKQIETGFLNQAFYGHSLEGTWTLTVEDKASGDKTYLKEYDIQFRKVPNGITIVDLDVNSNQSLGTSVKLDHVHYNINHPNPSELKVELQHDGQSHLIQNFGEVSSGSYTSDRITAFDGGSSDGTWYLKITDNANGNYGHLVEWGLAFSNDVYVSGCPNNAPFAFRATTDLTGSPDCNNAGNLSFAYEDTNPFSSLSFAHHLPSLSSPRDRWVSQNSDGVPNPDAAWEAYDRASDSFFTALPLSANYGTAWSALSLYLAPPAEGEFAPQQHHINAEVSNYVNPAVAMGSGSTAEVAVPFASLLKTVKLQAGTDWNSAPISEADVSLYLKDQSDVSAVLSGMQSAAASNYASAADADEVANCLAMLDIPTEYPLPQITSSTAPSYTTLAYGIYDVTPQAHVTTPRWYTGPLNHSAALQLPTSTAGTLTDGAGGVFRNGASVDAFHAATLDVSFQEEETFEDGVLHLAYPITDASATVADQSGQDAINSDLSYWGFPNGQQGYAEFYVELLNLETGATFPKLVKSTSNPFVNKNCPYLIQDSLVMDIQMSELPAGFGAGDRVDVSAVAFWATHGRRTLLFTHNNVANQQVLCATPETVALSAPMLGAPMGGSATISLDWEMPTGGRSFVEFRAEGQEDWTTLTSAPGLLRTTSDAQHNIDLDTYRCDVLEYRIRTELCTHTIYSNVSSVLIDADVDNPWEAIGAGTGDIVAEKGYRDDKIWVDWSVVQDDSDAFGIDSYRVERRPYLPALQGSDDDWQVVFSSIDEWSWFDETASAGLLYEYRVAAIIDCGAGKYAEYYSPNAIGFRTAVAKVNGQVTYGSGAPVDSVRLDVEKMTGADARLALQLQDAHFLDLPATGLREDLSGGFTQTQWIRLDAFRTDEAGQADLTPLISWWVEDSDGEPAELMSLRARPVSGNPDTLALELYRAGDPVEGWTWPSEIPGWNRGAYRHLTSSVEMHAGEDSLALTLDGNISRQIKIGLQSDIEADLSTLVAVKWGAGQDLVEGCIDPAATSFDPLASLTNADLCTYDEQTGCADPAASNFSALAEIDIQNCTYYANQIGTAFRINWFSDGSEDAENEYPVILNHAGVVVWSAEDAPIATGVMAPWEVRTYRLALEPGSYEMGVHREGFPVDDGVFEGNFDLYDEHGNEYVNCTQYFTTDFLNDLGVPNPYLFEVNNSECSGVQSGDVASAAVTLEGTQTGAIPAVTDCANCYSWRFDGGSTSNGYFEDTWSRSTPVTTYSIETWIQPHAGAMTGKKLVFAQRQNWRRIELYLDDGQLAAGINDGNNEWYFHAENSLDPAAGASKLLPYQWYHVIFTLDTESNEASLVARPTSFNDSDAQVWNDAIELTCDGMNCTGGDITDINFSTSNIRLGGSHRALDSTLHFYGNFEGLIHRLSVWDRVLSETEQLDLFDGPTDEWYNGHGSGLIWVSTAISSDRAHNRLDGSANPDALNVVENTSGTRRVRSVRRAPFGTCIPGCNVLFDQYGAQAAPGNFNPFANDYTDCDLAPTGVTIGSEALATGAISLDEVRFWKDVLGEDANGEPKFVAADSSAIATAKRYVDYNSPGLVNYLEFDEAVGQKSYDRARNEQGEWLKRNAEVMRFTEATGLVSAEASEDFFINGEPLELRNEAYTDSLGQYTIESIKYTGTGNTFKIDPEKGPPAHTFGPTQFNANLGDANRNQSNLNFTDLSSFELDVEVVFQGRAPLGDYNTGTGVPDEDFRCPVQGAQFMINGALQYNPDYSPLTTDANGSARLTVPIGTQTIQVYMLDHTFASGGTISLTMTDDRLGDEGITFTDLTTSRGIGRVVGGLAQAGADWGTSVNNLGVAQFYLIPLDTLGGDVLGQCPAVPITTNALTGEFEADLLPLAYRIATASDAITNADGEYVHFQSVDETLEDITTGISITGWDLTPPDETAPDGGWFEALSGESFELDLIKGYAQNEEELVENTEQDAALPDGVSDRKDLVYVAPPMITTFQLQPTVTDEGMHCEDTLTVLPAELPVFIGAETASFDDGTDVYSYDLRNHFDNNIDAPLAFGVPIVEVRTVYCIGIAVTEHYRVDIPASGNAIDGTNHVREEFTLSSDDGLSLTIVDNLSQAAPVNVELEGAPVVWGMIPKMPEYSPGAPPLATFDLSLSYQGATIDWSPFSDYGNWQASRLEQVEALDEAFQAVVLGPVVTVPGIPLSTSATLDYILRDPPGDGSFATIEQGSSYAVNKSLTGKGHGELETAFKVSAAPDVEMSIFAGGFAGLGGGVVFGVSQVLDVDPEFNVTIGAKLEAGGGSKDSWTESLTINQSVSTSNDEQPGNSGVNQDVFFGRTENVYSTEIQRFGLTSELAMGLKASECVCTPYFHYAVGGDASPMPGVTLTNDDGESVDFSLAWNMQMIWEVAPASYFSKTQYDIETNIIPALEAQRNQEFGAGLGTLYAWPDGSTSGAYTYPNPGMYLANNDDPRWWLYHADEVTANGFSATFPLRPTTYSNNETSGPGYQFLGTDLANDQVRYYNNLITGWKLMLARNELDKLNARKFLESQIDDYDDLDEIENPLLNLLNDGEGYTSIFADNDELPTDLEDLWGSFDFQPFFLAFSGGAGEFSQSFEKTAVDGKASDWYYDISANIGLEAGFEVKGIGVTNTTTRTLGGGQEGESGNDSGASIGFSYTLTDSDEDDFYLVGVMPGRGADSPIFLNLGAAATSCPWDGPEPAKYEEFYLYFADNLEARVAAAAGNTVDCTATKMVWDLNLTWSGSGIFGLSGNYIITGYETLAEATSACNAFNNSSFNAPPHGTVTYTCTVSDPRQVPVGGMPIHEDICSVISSADELAASTLEVQPTTLQGQDVGLYVGSPNTHYIELSGPMDEPLFVDLLIDNKSQVGAAVDYQLRSIAAENEISATLSLGGGPPITSLFWVPPTQNGEFVEITAGIRSAGLVSEEYLEGDVMFEVVSLCDYQIRDTVRIHVTFEPACSDIELSSPADNWNSNVLQTWSTDQIQSTNDLLTVRVDGINRQLQNFIPDEAIAFQYRTSSDLDWNTFATTAFADLDSLQDGTGFFQTTFDVSDLFGDIEDDAVMIRAETRCSYGLKEVTDIAIGAVDRINPDLFGQPLPLDRVYDPEDEFLIRFNEPMDDASFTTADVTLTGHFNGESDWAGGVAFSGAESIVALDGPSLMNHSWTATGRLWVDFPGAERAGTLFGQGDDSATSLRIGFDESGDLELVRTTEGTSTSVAFEFSNGSGPIDQDDLWTAQRWNRFQLTLAYDRTVEGLNYYNVTLTVEGVTATGEIGIPDAPSMDFVIGNDATGGSPLSLPLSDLRLWQGDWNAEKADNPEVTDLTGKEVGLAFWLPTTELTGQAADHARGRTLLFDAHWVLPEGGGALQPSLANEPPVIGGIAAASVQSSTLEFWFKPGAFGETILSSHSLRPPGASGEVIDEQAWSIRLNNLGQIEVLHRNLVLQTLPQVGAGWQHLALVRETASTIRLYLDGTEIGSMAVAPSSYLFPVPLHIGAQIDQDADGNAFYDEGFTGLIDELRFWGVALEPEAIVARQHVRIGYDPSLVFYAPFDSLGVTPYDGLNLELAEANAELYVAASGSLTGDPSGFGTTDIGPAIVLGDAALIPLQTSEETSLPEDILGIDHNASNDEFIVEFNPNRLWRFEDQRVNVNLSNDIRDALGNPLATPHAWSFIFDRHPLSLLSDEWQAQTLIGEAASTSFTLTNTGIDPEPWNLTHLPEWLSASPESGILNPLESVTISLVTATDLNLGSYIADFRIEGDFCDYGSPQSELDDWCYGERFSVEVLVEAEAPELTFDPSGLDGAMSIVTRLYNQGYASYDERDIVYAYINGELRGQASIDIPVGPQRLAYLTVFFDSETETDEPIEFRVWDASRGMVFAGLETHWPDLQTQVTVNASEEGIGGAFDPLLLNATNRIQQDLTLESGWNWLSFNTINDSMGSLGATFGETADHLLTIKDQATASQPQGDGTWFGTLDSLKLDNMYQIQMSATPDSTWLITRTGEIPDRVGHAQTVKGGWNHLGYLAFRELPVETALRSLWDADTVLTVNDVIKSRYDGFATYLGNGEWAGSLQWMRPGQGYKLRIGNVAAGTPAGTLVYPAEGMMPSVGNRTADALDVIWPMAIAALPEQQNLVAAVSLPSWVPQDPEDAIGAFNTDGECVGQIQSTSLHGQTRYFLTAYGDFSGPLTFKWYSRFADKSWPADETVVFEPGALTGTFDDPFTLHFRNAGLTPAASFEDGSEVAVQSGDLPVEGSALSAHPVPFTDVITVTWRGDRSLKHLRLLDARGQVVQLLDCPAMQAEATGRGYTTGEREPATCSWSFDGLSPGLYFLHGATEVEQVELKIQKQ